MRDHGGNLDGAIKAFGGDRADWIDLSTGINTVPYPVGPISPEAWTRLPEGSALGALEDAARRAYGASCAVVPVSGAQAAIQLVPRLIAPGQAAILSPTYNEHAAALRAEGWQVTEATDLAALEGYALAVVVNPNNPDGQRHAPDALRALAETVELLIVDESFADPDPEVSLVRGGAELPKNILVMRSFGKFYGLAGLRLGFVLAAEALAERLRAMTGPWPVSGMAIEVALRALNDTEWAAQTTARLQGEAAQLDAMAARAGWVLIGGTPLFRTYATPDATAAQNALAAHHIWSRIFPYSDSWIRLGLPGPAGDWARLETALKDGA
ncbi:threonine-phosphate decarboxylase [Sulfitobacter pontiacus]|uniref:threonine-phosphate decarboxylase CobD n=1 Tax=Sulfitobacter pontiacus TaxID=60137 RepID=UPI0007D95632|nr:threonine-phosphate decarboxylase CobD [Sulfitobacter pontiacus]OAN73782.1 threonine-phosphate decarboxylase [Sulfitobacter pontiacus]